MSALPTEPLASRMRPVDLSGVVGQNHILGKDKPLGAALEAGQIHSLILWGPPGVGKTTIARLIATHIDARFVSLSAVMAGIKDIRQAIDQAESELKAYGRKTILFIDEVHRFNKSQQDAFLPHIEDGTIVFIGATTENPSFELNNALLSRCKVYVLKRIQKSDIETLIQSALTSSLGLHGRLGLTAEQVELLAESADGDARQALTLLEVLSEMYPEQETLTDEQVLQVIGDGVRRFDKRGDLFYDQISALHKAVRGSNPDAALYWFARMIDGGCDPLYLARRLVRMASEDVGLADPRALELALNGWETYTKLGSPEGELAIAQVVVYLAVASKSNALYTGWKRVNREVSGPGSSLEVPKHLRNAPTQLMKDLEHGKGYRYAHEETEHYAAGENYFPEGYQPPSLYEPSDQGLEIRIKEKLERLRAMDQASNNVRKHSP